MWIYIFNLSRTDIDVSQKVDVQTSHYYEIIAILSKELYLGCQWIQVTEAKSMSSIKIHSEKRFFEAGILDSAMYSATYLTDITIYFTE